MEELFTKDLIKNCPEVTHYFIAMKKKETEKTNLKFTYTLKSDNSV